MGAVATLPRALAVLAGPGPRRGEIRVHYGQRVPGPGERVHGGLVKLHGLRQAFPDTRAGFNVLYLVSSAPPPGAGLLAACARRRGARLVWNQNGVAYPAWDGAFHAERNAPMARLLEVADWVLYQSDFCRRAADRYLGLPSGPAEVLFNCVDTGSFTPAASVPSDGPVLLAAGTHAHHYRVATAIETLALVRRAVPTARLVVAGRLAWTGSEPRSLREARAIAVRLGVAEGVSFVGAYTPAEAPDLLRAADLLLHTQYNDSCPSIVLEAMACGLPVVYSRSGGTPELVGEEAGIGVPCEESWEREIPPDPDELADGVLRILEDRRRFSEAARQRAVDRFDIRPWLDRHRAIFEGLTS